MNDIKVVVVMMLGLMALFAMGVSYESYLKFECVKIYSDSEVPPAEIRNICFGTAK